MKTVNHENEVKVRWQISGWHVPSMINVWTKDAVSLDYMVMEKQTYHSKVAWVTMLTWDVEWSIRLYLYVL
jgi:hypothetical protein